MDIEHLEATCDEMILNLEARAVQIANDLDPRLPGHSEEFLLRIFVPNSEEKVVRVTGSTTLATLKTLIAQSSGVPPEAQRIFYSGQQLTQPMMTLRNFRIPREATLHCFPKRNQEGRSVISGQEAGSAEQPTKAANSNISSIGGAPSGFVSDAQYPADEESSHSNTSNDRLVGDDKSVCGEEQSLDSRDDDSCERPKLMV